MTRRSQRPYKAIHVRLFSPSNRASSSRRPSNGRSKLTIALNHRQRSKVSPVDPSPSFSEVNCKSLENTRFTQSCLTSSKIQMKGNEDKLGSTDDHHRNKKRKVSCAKVAVILIVIMLVIILIAVSITLGILLSKKSNENKQRGREAVLRWNTTGTIVAGNGSGSASSNPIVNPLGFAFDDLGRIYAVESFGHRITRWIPGAPNGTVVAGLGNGYSNNTADAFFQPGDVLLNSNADMYITDRWNHRLQFWPQGASSAITLAGIGSNTSIDLYAPLSLVHDTNTNTIYIASTYSHKIVAYPSGKVFGVTNVSGNSTPYLNHPEGLVFDSFSNSLIIGNDFSHSIVQWKLGSVNWTLIAGVSGVSGNDAMHLNRPIGLTIDPMGNIYAADFVNSRVQLFMNGQSQGITIAGTGLNGTYLLFPGGVKLDSQLNLFVSDYYQNRIVKFSRY